MGVKITEPTNTTPIAVADWQAFISRTTIQAKGHIALSISNFASTTEPKIQVGSLIEVNGAFYQVNTEESITGWTGISNDTQDVFIKCVPAGNACTFAFTTTAPTWSDSKQGWYDSNDRYTNYMLSRGASASDYNNKRLIPKDITVLSYRTQKKLDMGDWNMDTTASLLITHGVNTDAIRSVEVVILSDLVVTDYNVYNFERAGSYIFQTSPWRLSLSRDPGGFFDDPLFDATSYNRGYITIEYEGYIG
jgi:spore germination protein YaaH